MLHVAEDELSELGEVEGFGEIGDSAAAGGAGGDASTGGYDDDWWGWVVC